MGHVRRNLAVSVGRALAGLAALGLLAAPWAHAQAAEESIDDPKVARRLGTRIDWVSPPGVATAHPGGPPAVGPGAPAVPVAPTTGATPEPVPPAAGATPLAATPTVPPVPVGSTPSEPVFQPVLPRVQLAFRRFDFVRIGASDSNGLAASEAFDALSLDVYPMSSLVRLGLSTAYGWQAGMTSGGDYFATETASFGPQLDFGRVVPFAEALAGIGYMRRFQFAHTVPTVFWQLGIDLGASVYFARIGFVSVALGYLRPVNGFLRTTSFETVYTNTWSFKIGIGI
ncbi:MAG TPA: hypothetical protein VFG23_14420 [Polyangia bacterium]|nr:hypothetical protein [Polyangia bacterium]